MVCFFYAVSFSNMKTMDFMDLPLFWITVFEKFQAKPVVSEESFPTTNKKEFPTWGPASHLFYGILLAPCLDRPVS